jgi:hypothetical protein
MLSMAAVRLAAIDARQSAGRPNGGFAGGSPEREISHARQSLEVNVIDRPKAMHNASSRRPGCEGVQFRIHAKGPPPDAAPSLQ